MRKPPPTRPRVRASLVVLYRRCIDVLSVFALFLVQANHIREGQAMEAKKKRLTLDLDPAFQRRLKVISAIKGVSMRRYCQITIDRELTKGDANEGTRLLYGKPDHESFAEPRQEIFGGKPLPGSSADLIKEARQLKDAENEGWTLTSSSLSMLATQSSGLSKRRTLTKPRQSSNHGLLKAYLA